MINKYKTSKYNYIFSYNSSEYVYNTFSGALAKLPENGKARLLNFDDSELVTDDFIQTSIKNGLIIPADVDETEILNFTRSNAICQEKHIYYEILPTTACNARCFYCFENGVKPVSMTLETAKKVCDFIISQSPSKETVLIQWFGGEPLLCPDVITFITQTLDQELSKQKVKIKYQMTTNGSLITDEMIHLFKDVWHISKVQITLDGTKEIYEKRKAYINFPNSFDTVINNINLLANNGITVAIRLNYDHNNINDILNLIDYLGLVVQNKDKVICYAYPLFDVNSSRSPEEYETAVLLIDITKRIINNNLSHGKKHFNLHFITNKCYACLRKSFLINPEGNLAKCSTAMGEDDFIGNVYSSIPLTQKYLKWCSTELPSKECHDCIFLPLCQGGCKAGHLGHSSVKHYIFKNCFTEILTEIIKENT